MFRSLLLTALLATSAATAAQAQSGSLTIAYVKPEGSSASIYLTNDTGSSTVKLYATAAKTTIASLDLKPGGGEIAFIEQKSGVTRAIKILTFSSSSGTPSSPVRSLTGPCNPDTLDYHPSQPVLIFSDVCNQRMNIAKIATDGSGYEKLHESAAAPNDWWFGSPRWLKDGVSYVYARAVDPSGQQLCRDACEQPLWTGQQVGRMDVGRATNRVLLDGGTSYITEIDADTGAILRPNFINGIGGHYGSDNLANPNDLRILYATPHQAKGNYLQIRNADGSFTRISAKGDYRVSDWRP